MVRKSKACGDMHLKHVLTALGPGTIETTCTLLSRAFTPDAQGAKMLAHMKGVFVKMAGDMQENYRKTAGKLMQENCSRTATEELQENCCR